jgi:hypothetical protein
MFEDAVAQQNRILETYVDDDKARFRLAHLIHREDVRRFVGDRRAMNALWKEIKPSFKQTFFKDWWDIIHNGTPPALYGELVSDNVVLWFLGLKNLKRLPHHVCSIERLGTESQNSFPSAVMLWRRCSPFSQLLCKLMNVQLLVLLHGGRFSMAVRHRGSGQIGSPWSAQMQISDENRSNFNEVSGKIK